VHGRGHDDTTVSADSPAWIQIPRVTVNKLSSAQLANLVQWKAPLPMRHTEQKMLNSFFGVRASRCRLPCSRPLCVQLVG
jgi:hypothetical protein